MGVQVNYAAAIQFGRFVESNWIMFENLGTIKISEDEKQYIRQNMVQAIYENVNNQNIQK